MSVLINNTNADALCQCIRKRKYSSSKIKLNTAEMSALVDISERLFRKRQYPFSNFWKAECGLSKYIVRKLKCSSVIAELPKRYFGKPKYRLSNL